METAKDTNVIDFQKAKEAYTQLCVWPGTLLGEATENEFKKFFKEKFGVRVKLAEEVVTNPDLDGDGNPIPETGGRHDVLFWVHTEDCQKFAVPRLKVGIRWWEDVVSYNDNSHLYSQEVLNKYPVTW